MKKGAHFKGTRVVKFSEVLAKFSQHTIMNIHVKDIGGEWDEKILTNDYQPISAATLRNGVSTICSRAGIGTSPDDQILSRAQHVNAKL